MTTKKRLCAIKGITEAKVDKIKVQEKMNLTNLSACFLIIGSFSQVIGMSKVLF